MFTTIITDCKSENAKGRQESRFNSYGLGPTSFVGVSSSLGFDATIEASGNLIDILDSTEGIKGIIVVNVAPRGDKISDGPNGSDFCYFSYKDTLVISTIKGYCLSLPKRLGLINQISVVNIKDVCRFAHKKGLISKDLVNHISNTQFRSFEFVPRLAKWLSNGLKVPHSKIGLKGIPNIPSCIWSIDAFGNCKTTLTKADLKSKGTLKTNLGTFSIFERLSEIPKNETGIYVGSSGIKNNRFLEIATQSRPGSATKELQIKIGSRFVML